jgi:hypothetical protein
VVTFHPAPGEMLALAREVGPGVYWTVVRPVIQATVRRVLAGWRADQLDSGGIVRAQAEIVRISAARLRPHHIVLDSISLRTLSLVPSSAAYRQVVSTGIKEQEVLGIAQTLELARQRADDRRHAAHGIADAHARIAPSLTPDVLFHAATRAWSALLRSPTSTVHVRDRSGPSFLEVEP